MTTSYIVFRTIGDAHKSVDHYQVVSSEVEAREIYHVWVEMSTTYCAGYAPITDSTDWN